MINIAIIGPVGVGKTTIIRKIKEGNIFNKINFIEEEEKYIFLEKQYNNRKEWAFITQLDFLFLRIRTLFKNNELKNIENNSNINIFDRLYLDDFLYFKFNLDNGFISKEEKEHYLFVFNFFTKKLEKENIKIDLIIILQANNDQLISRRQERNRFNEDDLKDEFKKIENLYNSTFFTNLLNEYKEKNNTKLLFIENYDLDQTVLEVINNIKLLIKEKEIWRHKVEQKHIPQMP